MTGTGSPAGLPVEAYAAALAGLPGMGPARLTAVTLRWACDEAWADLTGPESATSRTGWREIVAQGRGDDELISTWRRRARAVDVQAVWARLVDLGVGVARYGGAGYPPALLEDAEPPAVVFHLGDLGTLGRRRVAVVGTRRCTPEGRGIAFELGRDLARGGVAVLSGLALGIDGAAHLGALSVGSTGPVGVVATGLDVVYPLQHRELWRRVARHGLLLSEAPPGTGADRWRFPARNRILAGLADLVIVVESHGSGGALYTVEEADRRGVEVMVVPGSLRSPSSAGCNNLLAEGRAPVRSADDVLTALGLSEIGTSDRGVEARPEPQPGDRALLDALGWQPVGLDHIVARTGRTVPEVAGALTRLAAQGWVRRSGPWYEQVAPG